MQDGPESPGDTCEVKQREKKNWVRNHAIYMITGKRIHM